MKFSYTADSDKPQCDYSNSLFFLFQNFGDQLSRSNHFNGCQAKVAEKLNYMIGNFYPSHKHTWPVASLRSSLRIRVSFHFQCQINNGQRWLKLGKIVFWRLKVTRFNLQLATESFVRKQFYWKHPSIFGQISAKCTLHGHRCTADWKRVFACLLHLC